MYIRVEFLSYQVLAGVRPISYFLRNQPEALRANNTDSCECTPVNCDLSKRLVCDANVMGYEL